MRQVMSKNFSIPMSEANPDSVTKYSPSLRATRSATSELLPWAMFMKGQQWTKAGWPSSVWTRFRLDRFLEHDRERACWLLSCRLALVCLADRDLPSRSRRSGRSRATATMAMISLAAVMSKPVWRG